MPKRKGKTVFVVAGILAIISLFLIVSGSGVFDDIVKGTKEAKYDLECSVTIHNPIWIPLIRSGDMTFDHADVNCIAEKAGWFSLNIGSNLLGILGSDDGKIEMFVDESKTDYVSFNVNEGKTITKVLKAKRIRGGSHQLMFRLFDDEGTLLKTVEFEEVI